MAAAKYLLPMVKGSVDGYYKIKGYKVNESKVTFSLGEFISLGSDWVHIYDKMKPGELLTKEECVNLIVR